MTTDYFKLLIAPFISTIITISAIYLKDYIDKNNKKKDDDKKRIQSIKYFKTLTIQIIKILEQQLYHFNTTNVSINQDLDDPFPLLKLVNMSPFSEINKLNNSEYYFHYLKTLGENDNAIKEFTQIIYTFSFFETLIYKYEDVFIKHRNDTNKGLQELMLLIEKIVNEIILFANNNNTNLSRMLHPILKKLNENKPEVMYNLRFYHEQLCNPFTNTLYNFINTITNNDPEFKTANDFLIKISKINNEYKRININNKSTLDMLNYFCQTFNNQLENLKNNSKRLRDYNPKQID